MSVVGFDFGYQSCYIAVARQGGIETVSNEYSSRLTSNVISFGEKCRFLGESAKQYVVSNIHNTVWGYKRLLGRRFKDPQVQTEKSRLPYTLIEHPSGEVGIQVRFLNEDQVFSAEQITAMMFTKLKQTTEAALKVPCVDCVISVPCYFTDIERRSVLAAAQMAGLKCLRLMNDTTAVALTYGIYKQDLPAPEEKPRNVVFVDLGHADLQVGVCAFNKGKLKMLATAHDHALGGRDLDTYLANHFAAEFKKKYKVDAMKKPKAYQRLLTDVSGSLNREGMETLAAPFFLRLEHVLRDALTKCKLKLDDVYAVEIVGGATRVPAVKQLVTKVYGREPSTTLNQDEAVARGCALQCAILSPTFRVRDFNVQDCQPYSITLRWRSVAMDEADDMEVFSQFHAIPQSKMLSFFRSEPFTLDAFYTQPGSVPHPAAQLGSFKVEQVVPAASGESSKVKVKLRVNSHGIFCVSQATLVEKLEPGAVEEEEKMDVEGEDQQAQMNGLDAGAAGAAEAASEQKDEQIEQDGEGNQGNGDAKEAAGKEEKDGKEGKKKKEEKKPKKTIKYHDLPVVATVAGPSQTDINLLMEKEGKMVAHDRLEKERADAKNAVEEYVYELRDKLSTEYEPFVTEAEKEDRKSVV